MMMDVMNYHPNRFLTATFKPEQIDRSSFKPHRVRWRGKRMSWCTRELLAIKESVREIERREDERIKRLAAAMT